MSANHKNFQNFLIGAAIVATGVLGTLTTLLLQKETNGKWIERVKKLASQSIGRREIFNKNLFAGGVAGGIVGVTTALLLTPKSGSDLIRDIYRPFVNDEQHVRPSTRKKAMPSVKSKHQKAQQTTQKTIRKLAEKKSPKSSRSKRTLIRSSHVSKTIPDAEKGNK